MVSGIGKSGVIKPAVTVDKKLTVAKPPQEEADKPITTGKDPKLTDNPVTKEPPEAPSPNPPALLKETETVVIDDPKPVKTTKDPSLSKSDLLGRVSLVKGETTILPPPQQSPTITGPGGTDIPVLPLPPGNGGRGGSGGGPGGNFQLPGPNPQPTPTPTPTPLNPPPNFDGSRATWELIGRYDEFDQNKNGVLSKDELAGARANCAQNTGTSQATLAEMDAMIENERELSFTTEALRNATDAADAPLFGISRADLANIVQEKANNKTVLDIAAEARQKTAAQNGISADPAAFRQWVDQQRGQGKDVSYNNSQALDNLINRYQEFDANQNGILNTDELTKAKQRFGAADQSTLAEMDAIIENNRELTLNGLAQFGFEEVGGSSAIHGLSLQDLQSIKEQKATGRNIDYIAMENRVAIAAKEGVSSDAAAFRQWVDQKRQSVAENQDDVNAVNDLTAGFDQFDKDKNGVLDEYELSKASTQSSFSSHIDTLTVRNESFMFASGNNTSNDWMGLTKADLASLKGNLAGGSARTLNQLSGELRTQAAQQYGVSADPQAFSTWVQQMRTQHGGQIRADLIKQVQSLGIELYAPTEAQISNEILHGAIEAMSLIPESAKQYVRNQKTRLVLVEGADVRVYPDANKGTLTGRQGVFLTGDNTMVVNTRLGVEKMLDTLLHEYGHGVDGVKDNFTNSPEWAAARRTMTWNHPEIDGSAEESFAEAFNFFYLSPETRASLSPEIRDYMLRHFGPPKN